MPHQCKYSGYGNCGPKKGDDGFCLFHQPVKNRGERNAFYEALIKEKGVHEETVDSYDPLIGVNPHTRLVFEGQVDFRGYYFPKVPTNLPFGFGQALFNGGVSFRNARFYAPIFSHAIFQGGVDFRGAGFYHGVRFNGAAFAGWCAFAGAWFQERTSFDSVLFSGKANFSAAIFEKDVSFSGATFDSGADFETTIFKEGLSFQGADVKLDFSLVSLDSPDFSTQEDGPTPETSDGAKKLLKIIDEENVELPTLLIPGDEASREFDDQKGFPVQIIDRDDFRVGISNFPIDDLAVERMRSYLEADVRLSDYDAMREAYRMQKLSFKQNARKQEADQMYVREMRANRRAHRVDSGAVGSLRAAVEWLIADFSCGYGTDWQRVLLLSLSIVGSSGVMYLVGDQLTIGGSLEFAAEGEPVSRPLVYFYYSIVTFITLGTGGISANGLLALVSAVEGVSGVILSALLVAVFIKKWAD